MDEEVQREVCEKLEARGYAVIPDSDGNIYVANSHEELEASLEAHRERERERDIIVVGGGSSVLPMLSRSRIGLGFGGIGMKFAALALAQNIACEMVVTEPVHDYLHESKSRPSSRAKELSAGERKLRNKKLKTQRNSRRYNRKG